MTSPSTPKPLTGLYAVADAQGNVLCETVTHHEETTYRVWSGRRYDKESAHYKHWIENCGYRIVPVVLLPAQIDRTDRTLPTHEPNIRAEFEAKQAAIVREALKPILDPKPPPSFLYPLFEHMSREHGLTLLDSELQEIVNIATPLAQSRVQELETELAQCAEHARVSALRKPV